MLELPVGTPVEVKLECDGYRYPCTLLRTKNDRIEFVRSPFKFKDEIKAMQGARWHGMDDKPRKIWSVAYSPRNLFQLEWLAGGNPYAQWEKDCQELEYARPLKDYQKRMVEFISTVRHGLLYAEMGCLSGDTMVTIGRKHTYQMSLKNLHYKFNGGVSYGGKKWKKGKITTILALKEGHLGHHKILNVVYKGKKKTIKIELTSGESICVTENHPLYTSELEEKPASQVSVDDVLLVSSSIENSIPWDKNFKVVGEYKEVYLPSHPRARNGMVREHVLVLEEKLGRFLSENEVVHHINGDKGDNDITNLLLMTRKEHNQLHINLRGQGTFSLSTAIVSSIVEQGEEDVYDIILDDPYHSFVANGFIVSNCGKTLSAIEVMERSNFTDWLWVGPKSGLRAVAREFEKWDLSFSPKVLTYEGLVREVNRWDSPIPRGVIFDESSRLKNHTTKRAQAAQWLADQIREKYGFDGYIVLMSGTPSPKAPIDHWSQAEIASPGFLKEGSIKAFERRLAIHRLLDVPQGTVFQRATWLDDERKCNICGGYLPHVAKEIEKHKEELGIKEVLACEENGHKYTSSKNEVALLNDRLEGLAMFVSKDKYLDLPEKVYEQVILEPSSTMLRVAKVITETATSAIQALTLLRELSDGFQYREVDEGKTECKYCNGKGEVDDYYDPEDPYRALTQADFEGHVEHRVIVCPICAGDGEVPKRVRMTRKVACPKELALIEQLDLNSEIGRLVVFAGFTGSIDRITEVCLKYGWDVVKVDGRGWEVLTREGKKRTDPLSYWSDMDNQKVVFVAHPQSGGMGLTLTEARTCIYYSNDFNPESRTQSEDRIHRLGQNHTVRIIDFIHLPTDTKVLNTLKDNRRLEKMTLGELREAFTA